jgi:Sap, sulfolipid-1-addressing protein
VTSVDVELGLTALAAMLSPTTLSFTVLALVLSERPGQTGVWFFLGAFGVTIVIGVVAAFALGDSAAPANSSSETPPTWVAILDVVAGALLLVYVVRALRRPRDPQRAADAIENMGKVASSPAIAIVAAGATLANPGGFIPIALKDISQLSPSTGEYIVLWVGFALVALLPLLVSLLSLLVARDRTLLVLRATRGWLERHARTLAAVIVLLLAAVLLRNGIVALTS